MSGTFRVGAAEVDITPSIGRGMDGYIARTDLSDGQLDPLLAQVLIVASADHRAVIVSLDLLAVTASFADDLRTVLAAQVGTTPDAVFIAASHTHAGPSGAQDWFPVSEHTQLDSTLTDRLRQQVLEAAATASARMRPATLSSASGDLAGVATDRNIPDATIDRQATVLRFDDERGQPLALLFHYACHPTVLSASNTRYSADYVGAARRTMRARYPAAIPLYLNGAAGNISTRFQRHDQSYNEVNRLGGLLGERVLELLDVAQPEITRQAAACTGLSLPLRNFAAEARSLQSTGNTRFDTVRAEGVAIEADLKRVFAQRAALDAQVCGLRIGAWKLLTVPGEAFSEMALRLREADPQTLVVGYANDYLGYFPTQQAIDSHTYEALSSPYDATGHERLYDALLDLVQQLNAPAS